MLFLLVTACQKEGDELPLTEEQLVGSWWKEERVQIDELDASGGLIGTVVMDADAPSSVMDGAQVGGLSYYFDADFCGSYVRLSYPASSELNRIHEYATHAYRINERSRQLTIGNQIYDVDHFSKNEMILRHSYSSSGSRYVVKTWCKRIYPSESWSDMVVRWNAENQSYRPH